MTTQPFGDKSVYKHLLDAVAALETAVSNMSAPDIAGVTGLSTALGNLSDAIDGKAASVHTHAQSDITGLVAALASLGSRLTAVENLLAAIGIKSAGVYSGTTDANGDVSVTFPTGKFTNAPVLFTTYIFNNNSYGTHYNVKALSNTAAQLRVHRNKNTSIGALGGDVDPDESLASTAVRVVALEF